MPTEVYQMMALYPQTQQRSPVEYVPMPYRSRRGLQPSPAPSAAVGQGYE
jgi:hypothetical protein